MPLTPTLHLNERLLDTRQAERTAAHGTDNPTRARCPAKPLFRTDRLLECCPWIPRRVLSERLVVLL